MKCSEHLKIRPKWNKILVNIPDTKSVTRLKWLCKVSWTQAKSVCQQVATGPRPGSFSRCFESQLLRQHSNQRSQTCPVLLLVVVTVFTQKANWSTTLIKGGYTSKDTGFVIVSYKQGNPKFEIVIAVVDDYRYLSALRLELVEEESSSTSSA